MVKHQQLKEAQLTDFKLRNGCGLKPQKEPRYTIGQINFHNCLCDHLHPDFSRLLFLHSKYQDGVLPYPGSLSEQPSHVIEIFKMLDEFKWEAEQEAARNREKKKK